MTVQVNIGEAKTRLSELVSAALRGDDVILARAGAPQVRLVPLAEARSVEQARIAANRRKAFGMWRDLVGDRVIDVRALKMSDAEQNREYERKFGDPARYAGDRLDRAGRSTIEYVRDRGDSGARPEYRGQRVHGA